MSYSYLTDLVNIIDANMEFVLIGVAVAALIFLILFIITIVNPFYKLYFF